VKEPLEPDLCPPVEGQHDPGAEDEVDQAEEEGEWPREDARHGGDVGGRALHHHNL